MLPLLLIASNALAATASSVVSSPLTLTQPTWSEWNTKHQLHDTRTMSTQQRATSALNREGGPRGIHLEHHWRANNLRALEVIDATSARLTHVPNAFEVSKGDVLHLDAASAQLLRRLEPRDSIPTRHYRILSVSTDATDSATTLKLRPCAIEELFEELHLDATIHFNGIRQGSHSELLAQTTAAPATSGDEGNDIIADMARSSFYRMSTLGAKVSDELHFSQTSFGTLPAADIHGDASANVSVINYHYDAADAATCQLNLADVFGAEHASGTCDNCYVNAPLTVTLSIDVTNYVLSQASVRVVGDMDISISGDSMRALAAFEGERQVFSFANSFELMVDGVSIPVDIETPVTLAMSATAPAPIKADVLLRASVDVSMNYDGHLSTTNKATFAAAGQGIKMNRLNYFEGAVTLGLTAASWLQVHGLGGPIFSLSATPELGAGNDDAACTYGRSSASLGVEGTVGGKLMVMDANGDTLLDLEQAPVAVVGTKFNIASGCVSGSGASTLPAVGTVYRGTLDSTPTTLDVSAQVVSSEAGSHLELLINAYAATSQYASDTIGNYVFDLSMASPGGNVTLQSCLAASSLCEFTTDAYAASTGADAFVLDPSQCIYAIDTFIISCTVFDGSTLNLWSAPLQESLPSGMAVADAAFAAACPTSEFVDDDDSDAAATFLDASTLAAFLTAGAASLLTWM